MTSSTTLENNYTTNSIINSWLTLRTKLFIPESEQIKEKDLDKFQIVIEEM
ncbi:MAG: hypothetical protein ACI4S3_01120 [Candidatus Gastranaerophilaceae bacterium]